jgi:type II secretory pathway pseudopilin PulG
MNVFEFLAIAILILSGASVIVIDRLFGFGRRANEHQVRLAEQHAQQLAERVSELERHNDELRQQLEWNRRLLEAQDRVLQQLGAGAVREELPPSPQPRARAART